LNDVVPENVLSVVHEQASRIASNSGSALSITIVFSILVSLWSAVSGIKAMIDGLNVIYEQKETRSFIKLNLVALVFTLAGFAGDRLDHCPAAGLLPFRLWQPDRDTHASRSLAGAANPPIDWSRCALPLRPGSPSGALAVGDCRQLVRCSDVDRSVVPVLLVSQQLRELQRDLRIAWRRRWRDGLVVDFDDRDAAWR